MSVDVKRDENRTVSGEDDVEFGPGVAFVKYELVVSKQLISHILATLEVSFIPLLLHQVLEKLDFLRKLHQSFDASCASVLGLCHKHSLQ
jgi:hypothetical protein